MRVITSKILLLLAVVLTMASCKHWNLRIDTEINRDGSCTRRLWTDVDTCLVMDESWEMTQFELANDSVKSLLASGVSDWRYDINLDDDSTVVYVISREFDNVGDMTSNPVYRLYDRPVTSKASLDRKFKWFYTDYVYTETFDGWEKTFPISLDGYFDDDDQASFMFTGYPEMPAGLTGMEMADYLSKLQEGLERWENAVLWDVELKVMEEYYDYFINPPVDYETFVSKHHKIINCANRRGVYILSSSDDDFSEGLKEVLKEVFGSDEVYNSILRAEDMNWGLRKQMDDKWEMMSDKAIALFAFNGSYTLKMPGKVIDAGHGIVEDGIVKYRFKGTFLVPGDYTFTATSRCVNVWAFLLAGLVITVAVGSFFIGKKN